MHHYMHLKNEKEKKNNSKIYISISRGLNKWRFFLIWARYEVCAPVKLAFLRLFQVKLLVLCVHCCIKIHFFTPVFSRCWFQYMFCFSGYLHTTYCLQILLAFICAKNMCSSLSFLKKAGYILKDIIFAFLWINIF